MSDPRTITIGSITVTSDGTGAYDLISWDQGQTTADNTVAESARRSGGTLTATRRRITPARIVIRVTGTDADDLRSLIDALDAETSARSYTVTVSDGTGSVGYACMPASWTRADDSMMALDFMDIVTVTMPRQP